LGLRDLRLLAGPLQAPLPSRRCPGEALPRFDHVSGVEGQAYGSRSPCDGQRAAGFGCAAKNRQMVSVALTAVDGGSAPPCSMTTSAAGWASWAGRYRWKVRACPPTVMVRSDEPTGTAAGVPATPGELSPERQPASPASRLAATRAAPGTAAWWRPAWPPCRRPGARLR